MKFFKFFILSVLLVIAQSLFAIPVKPGLTKSLTLTDGTTIVATLVGDEHGHFWLGQDGKAYQAVPGTDAYWLVDAQAIISKANVRRAAANQRRVRRMAPRKVGDVGSITGKKKGLIILVNFSDVTFKSANNNALYQRIANEENFTYTVNSNYSFKGSMFDYFKAQSEGQFELTFDVVGPVTVSNKQAYYGGNDSSGNDLRPGAMVKEALALVNSQVNFANYDWDNDGEVEQVYVIYAGNGEADSEVENSIWPHEWDLYSATGSSVKYDGVTINTYACGGELNGNNVIAGIGTMCHEFSHCLGYPDFYDTDYSGGQGMGDWDLMCGGSYNDDGYQPAGYTSYERWVAGWKTPTTLVNTQTISDMAALQTTGSNSYIIYNKGNNNEYYLLENRQKTGWDASLPGAGLLILHVDYSSSAWSNNTPNDDPSHQRMTWVAADNQYQTDSNGNLTTNGMKNDPFPYGNINAFGKNTTPAATLYNKNSDNTYYLDSSIENITQNSNGTISFNFVGISNVATPTFSPAAGRYDDAQTVTISSETTGATIYYTLDGTNPTTSSNVYSSPLTISETKTVKAMAVKGEDQSAVATAKYTIGASTSNPNTTTFRLVSTVDDLEPGLRYVIACGSKSMAAGAIGSGTYLSNVQVNVSSDVITITDNVAVFVLEETNDGWTFQNEDTNQYLQSTAAKNVSYSSSAYAWTLSTGTEGVVMTAGENGTMLYNNSSPRFTTYTSNPTTAMIQANLYVEDSGSTPVVAEPLIVADETMTFSTTVGTPQTLTFEVLSEGLTEDITATLSGTNSNLFSLESSTISRTASELGTTGSVTFTPTAAGTFTATVTLTSAGADPVTISITGTATEGSTPVVTGNEFTLISSASDFVEGDYIIVYDNGAMNTTISGNRLQYTEVTPSNNVITTDDATIIWHIEPSGDYYTIYNAGENKFAASNGTKNQAQFLASGTDDKALWSVTTGSTFDFTNKYNSANSINATLRRNTTYGFACYASGTGGALSLYKRTSGGGTTPVTTVAAPTISGTTPFDNSTTVTITAETGASIYYTLDGTTPSASSTLYSAPFSLTATTTVKAIAIKDEVSSNVTTQEFVRNVNTVIAYYQPADGTMERELKTAMFTIIKNPSVTSYDGLWEAYFTTDVHPDGDKAGKIWDMYSNITSYTPVSSGSTYSVEGDCYNREHAFPQSWFGGTSPMKSDLFHVYPVDGYVNGMRSNNPYGETSGNNYMSTNNYSKLGTCTYPGYTGKVFEPADEYKGDFARTYFYIVTCYEDNLSTWYNSYSNTEVTAVLDGNTYPGFQAWQLEMLMKWAKNDPVSEKETNRNNAVYAIQGNRNPFIDYPGLQEYIWGFMTTSTFSYDNYQEPVYTTKQDVTMSFSPTTATATVGQDFTEPTLTTTPSGLTVTYSSSDTGVATVDAGTGEVTPVTAGTTTITATFAGNDTYNSGSASYELTVSASGTTPVTGSGSYALVTDASTLAAGDKIIIVNTDAAKALSTTQNNKNRSATSVTISNNTITPGDAVQIITLEKDGSNYLFNVGDGYLYAASSSDNYLRTEETADDNAKATISISNNDATITFQGTNTRNIIRYNPNTSNNNPLFSCYASSSTAGSLPQIYRETAAQQEKDDSDLAITSSSPVTLGITANNQHPTSTITWTTSSTGAMSFASSDESVATVSDGVITAVGPGSTTITVTQAADATYKASDAKTVNVTVNGVNSISLSESSKTAAYSDGAFTLTATVPTANYNGAVSAESSNTYVAAVEVSGTTITVTPLAVGTATITVTAGAGTYYPSPAQATCEVEFTQPAGSETATSSASGYTKITSTDDLTNGEYLIVYEGDATHDAVAFDGSLEKLDAEGNTVNVTISNNTIASSNAVDGAIFTISSVQGGYSIKSASNYYIGRSTDTNGLESRETALTNTVSFDTNGNVNIVGEGGTYLRYNYASNQTRFRYYKSSSYTGQQPIALYKKVATTATTTVSLNMHGYATYCSVNPIDFSDTDGYTAWRISDISNDGTITFTKITEKIKGGQGVLLYNKDADGVNTSEVTITFGDGTTLFSNDENKLRGTTAPTYFDQGAIYGLSGTTFLKNNAGNVRANKAYINAEDVNVTNASPTKTFTFVFNDPVTGISEVQNVGAEEFDAIFNLSGQRLNKPQRGVNIINGRKVLVK